MRFSRRYLSEQPRKLLREAGFSDYGIYHVLRKGRKLTPYMKEKVVRGFAIVKLKEGGLNLQEAVYQIERTKGSYKKLDNIRKRMRGYARELAVLNNPKGTKPQTSKAVSAILESMSRKGWIFPDIIQYMKTRRSASFENWTYYKSMKKKYGSNCTYQAAMEIKATKALFPNGGGAFPAWYRNK